MNAIESPFGDRTMRVKPWFQLRSEETSYIIYNAYRMHFLKSEEVKNFIWYHRLQQVTYWAFPLLMIKPIRRYVRSAMRSQRSNTASKLTLLTFGWTCFAWWTFSKISPFKKMYDGEKNNLLNYLDSNMGLAMLHFNNMLPRHWTENWVNGYTAQLYRQRHSRFFGMLYPPEGATNPIRDPEEFPEISEGGY